MLRAACINGLMGLAVMVAGRAAADDYSVLYRFRERADLARPLGQNPGQLTMGTKGSLYGIAGYGGVLRKRHRDAERPPETGGGTIFRLNTDGTMHLLHVFGRHFYSSAGFAGLLLHGQRLYGVSTQGSERHFGFIYSLKTDGRDYRTLHVFDYDNPPNDEYPRIPLIADARGTLYGGATLYEGGYDFHDDVYEITPEGSYSKLEVLQAAPDDRIDNLIVAPGSGYIGADSWSGDKAHFCGSIFGFGAGLPFKIPGPSGTCGPIVTGVDAAGDIYGYVRVYANRKGPVYNASYIFRLVKDADGTYAMEHLHDFTDDGHLQPAGLTLEPDGSLIGVANPDPHAPTAANSQLFRLAGGVLTVLHRFRNPAGGTSPEGNPVVTANGDILGTTLGGGDLECQAPYGCGLIYAYKP